MTERTLLLFVVVPYVCLASFVFGHVWRYRYDKFGWTTRSSQWYESRMLRWASPLFHFGLLAVLAGHVLGLLVPQGWTSAVGINEEMYHLTATILGGAAGLAMVVGLIGLIWRRRTTPAVFRATTRTDKLMYVVLVTVVLLGLTVTVYWQMFRGGYNYRLTVAPYFRSIFYLDPKPELMAQAPLLFQLHATAAFILFAIWPYTRLVHVLSAPVGYLWRPYIVYRSRDPKRQPVSSETKHGWSKPGLSGSRK